MTDRQTSISKVLQRLKNFRYILILEGIVSGAFASIVVVLFRYTLEKTSEIHDAFVNFCMANVWCIPIWFVILCVFAIAVYLLLKWEPFISGSGIPQVEGEMNGHLEQKWWRVLLAKCVGGVLAIGSGLSLGREGPSIQLGAMAAKGFARMAKRTKTEERIIMTCGAGAGLAAAFNAPFAGLLFCLEEMHKNFSAEVILSVMASSVTADFISRNVFGLAPVFAFSASAVMPLWQYWHVIVLGVALGLLGAIYNRSIALSQNLYGKLPKQTRLFIPFLCAGILAFVCPQVLGGGHNLAMQISMGQYAASMLCMLFVVKFVFSMVSFGSGAPGGIFLPLLVMGAMIGAIYYGIVGAPLGIDNNMLSNFIILGMAGYFSAIVRAPITGIILISEMTGSFNHLLSLTIVSLFAYIIPDLMKVRPIYDQLLSRILSANEKKAKKTGEKILIESIVSHGCMAQDKRVGDIEWPETCLVVSVVHGESEFVPNGNTMFCAGDRITLLCDENAVAEAKIIIEELFESVGCIREK